MGTRALNAYERNFKLKMEKLTREYLDKENVPKEKRAKKGEKFKRALLIKAQTIADENVILAGINDITYRFLMMFDEYFEDIIHEAKEDKGHAKKYIENQRKIKEITYANIDLKKQFLSIKSLIIEIQKEFGAINDEKILDSVNTRVSKEMKKINEELNKNGNLPIIFENSFQDHETYLLGHLLINGSLVEKLLPTANLTEYQKELTRKWISEVKIIENEWREYAKYWSYESKQAKVRDLMKLQGYSDESKNYAEIEKELLNLSLKQIKNKTTYEKGQLTKQKNKILKELEEKRKKEEKVNKIIKMHKDKKFGTEEELIGLKTSLLDMDEHLLDRELGSTEKLLNYVTNKKIKTA